MAFVSRMPPCVSLLLFLQLLTLIRQVLSVSLCPPAKEGDKFDVMYRAPPGKDISTKDLVWSVRYANGTLQEVSHCYNDEHVCFDFSFEFTPSRLSFESKNGTICTFEIAKVLARHRQMEIILETMSRHTGHRERLYSCQMEVFSQPEDPRCTAEKKSENDIKVECSAKGIYPGVICELYQINMETMEPARIDQELEYRQLVKSDVTQYREVRCSMTIFVPKRGRYSYQAKIMADIAGGERSVKSSLSDEVQVSKSTVAVVLEGPKDHHVNICPNHIETVNLTCEAHGFSRRRPRFIWTVNGKAVRDNNMRTTERPSPNGRVYYEIFQFTTSHSMIENIQCSAEYGIDSRSNHLQANDSLTLRFKRLTYLFTKMLYRDRLVKDGEKIDVDKDNELTCSLKENTQDSLGVEMACRRDGQLVVRKSSPDSFVVVSLANEKNGMIRCECKAQSRIKCRQRPVHAGLSLNDEVVHNEYLVNSTTGIIMAALVLALVIFIGVVILFKCRRNRSSEFHRVTYRKARQHMG